MLLAELICEFWTGLNTGGGQLFEGENQKNTTPREMTPAIVTMTPRRNSDGPFVFERNSQTRPCLHRKTMEKQSNKNPVKNYYCMSDISCLHNG